MNSVLTSIIYLIISSLLIILSKYTFDKVSQYKIEEQIKENNFSAI